MLKETKQPDLLDYLADSVGCNILSDLRTFRYRNALQRVLREIPPELFSAAEWHEALCYLLSPLP